MCNKEFEMDEYLYEYAIDGYTFCSYTCFSEYVTDNTDKPCDRTGECPYSNDPTASMCFNCR